MAGRATRGGADSAGRPSVDEHATRSPLRPWPLLSYVALPSMPNPWSSQDGGETWIWGDFFMNFLTMPTPIGMVINNAFNTRLFGDEVTCHYALVVFYRQDRNPYAPSRRPLMCVAVERRVELSGIVREVDGRMVSEWFRDEGPLKLVLYLDDKRHELEEYVGDMQREAARDRLFAVAAERLGLDGLPRCIGPLARAFGHPDTGLPPRERPRRWGRIALALGALCAALAWLMLR